MTRRVLAATLLAGALSPAPLAAQAILLRLEPPVGQVSTYSADMVMQFEMAGMGEMTTNMRMQMTQTITGIEGDVRTMEVTIDSMVMEGAPGMAANPAAQVEGMTMTMQMDSRGRPVAFQMPEGMGGPMGGISGGPLAQGFAQVFLPEGPVAPGAEWVDDQPMDLGQEDVAMEVDKNLRYRFERLDVENGARLATISVTGTISIKAEAPMQMTSDGDMRGTMVLDLDAGRFRTYSMEMDMVMEMPAMQAPATMSMTMEGTLVSGS